MQHDLDFDRAWDKVSKRFWNRRKRELAIHAALFITAQILMFFGVISRGVMLYTNSEPYLFLRYIMGIDQLPYLTVNWAVILGIHVFFMTAIALGERIFRYGVERELLRDFARSNQMDEKRKNRPAYHNLSDEETSFAYTEDGETAYNRSAR